MKMGLNREWTRIVVGASVWVLVSVGFPHSKYLQASLLTKFCKANWRPVDDDQYGFWFVVVYLTSDGDVPIIVESVVLGGDFVRLGVGEGPLALRHVELHVEFALQSEQENPKLISEAEENFGFCGFSSEH